MNIVRHVRRPLLPILAVAIGCAVVNCNSRIVRQAARIAGEEAAYAALQSALNKAGVSSASHITDALRMVVDKSDYGGAAAAFAVALTEHNSRVSQKLTSTQVIALMRAAVPAVRSASSRVGSGLGSFCDYLASKG